MVRARMTVGEPLCSNAALYAAYTLRGSWPPWRMRSQRFVRKVLDHFQQPRIASEYVLANVRAGFDADLLRFAVHHFAQALGQQAVACRARTGDPSRFPREP